MINEINVVGVSGGNFNISGTSSGYTSSGSGTVNLVVCHTNCGPNNTCLCTKFLGPQNSPPTATGMNLVNSIYNVNSTGAGGSTYVSGYGSGGCACPSGYTAFGTLPSSGGSFIQGGPGFIELMFVEI